MAWLRFLWCALHGHPDTAVHMYEDSNYACIFGRCRCGYESPGWSWVVTRRRA